MPPLLRLFFQTWLPGRRFLSAALLAHVLALVVLTASPTAHRAVHGDADTSDHDCAVVLFAHGGVEQASGPVTVPVFIAPPTGFAPLAVASGEFVPSVFATGGVFEHGPPTAG